MRRQAARGDDTAGGDTPPWLDAWWAASYGWNGFWRTQHPASHFVTAAQLGPWLAQAVALLARRWGHGRVVEVGAGGGELLAAVHRADPDLHLVGLDVRARPAQLAAPIEWHQVAPGEVSRWPVEAGLVESGLVESGLIVAIEWLDELPAEVVELDTDRQVRQVLVDRAGRQQLGPPAGPELLSWLARWWPLQDAEPGARAEVGCTRDAAWAGLVSRAAPGSTLLAIDYGHVREARPVWGSLTGYRHGRIVPAVPDGTVNITAHVAIDAVGAAGVAAGAERTRLIRQQEMLTRLGVLPSRPARAVAHTDPQGYLQELAQFAQAVRLVDPAGLGGFDWLVQHVPHAQRQGHWAQFAPARAALGRRVNEAGRSSSERDGPAAASVGQPRSQTPTPPGPPPRRGGVPGV